MKEFNNILYPVALTNFSARVAPYVVSLASQLNARLHVLHVLRPFDWFVDTYVSESEPHDIKRIASNFENEILQRAEEKLLAFEKRHLKNTRIAKSAVIIGIHYKEILDYVASEGIDMIILGTGLSAVKMMFGSVTEKVSKLSPVPVMLIQSSSH
jgi:nucleotide-binding universal stress UspA family protein